MRTSTRNATTVVVFAIAALPACGGNGQTVTRSQADGGQARGVDGGQVTVADGGQSGSYTLTALDDPCQGLTGRQVLGFIAASYTGTFTPSGATSTALEIGTGYSGGTITCHPMAMAGTSGCCSTCPCHPLPASISLDLDITFKTTDGALNERLAATATLASGETQGNWNATLPVAKIVGSYHVASGVTHLDFVGSFLNATMWGGVSELSPQTSTGIGDWTASHGGSVDAGKD